MKTSIMRRTWWNKRLRFTGSVCLIQIRLLFCIFNLPLATLGSQIKRANWEVDQLATHRYDNSMSDKIRPMIYTRVQFLRNSGSLLNKFKTWLENLNYRGLERIRHWFGPSWIWSFVWIQNRFCTIGQRGSKSWSSWKNKVECFTNIHRLISEENRSLCHVQHGIWRINLTGNFCW